MLEGEDAGREGLIDEVGGIKEALAKLHQMIGENGQKKTVERNKLEVVEANL